MSPHSCRNIDLEDRKTNLFFFFPGHVYTHYFIMVLCVLAKCLTFNPTTMLKQTSAQLGRTVSASLNKLLSLLHFLFLLLQLPESPHQVSPALLPYTHTPLLHLSVLSPNLCYTLQIDTHTAGLEWPLMTALVT